MTQIDIEGLLSKISDESPCGPDLRYDPAYLELEPLFQSRAEEEGEPNWTEAGKCCVELLGRTRDLRLASYVALVLLKTEGIHGLRDGLALLQGLLERFWDHLHPQLDTEDNNDPLERVNIIGSLSPPPESFQDPMMFQQRLREVPLCNSRQMGQFGLRDILIAKGELTPPDESDTPKPDMSVIDAAFEDTSTEELEDVLQAVEEAIGHVNGIESVLSNHVDSRRLPDLSGFGRVLTDIQKYVSSYLAKRGVVASPAEEGGGTVESEKETEGEKPLQGEIKSPQDVLAALEKVCRYYQQHEPSSPVPLLIRRAQRLVSKSFMDIIRDLSPEATKHIESIGGIDTDTPTE